MRNRPNKTISIDTGKYIKLILVKFGMEECSAIGIPMNVNKKYSRNMNECGDEVGKIPFREVIGTTGSL